MKKYIKYLLAAALCLGAISCTEQALDPESQIIDSNVNQNEFDRWLSENYLQPYNIDFKYRMERNESDMNYWLVPAEYNKAIMMAKLMLFLCIEPYDEVTGSLDFIKENYPKMIHLIGSAAYRNNNTMVLGTAEGGLKITMYYVNEIDRYVSNPDELNHYYFKTMHHEFTHILNQTKPYSTDFDMVSGNQADGYQYVTDSWSDAWSGDADAQKHGFISQYASSQPSEDFAELLSIYVTNPASYWTNIIKNAGSTGGTLITSKFDIVYNYMKTSWNIDLDELRDNIQERQNILDQIDYKKL